jgi:two-component system, response regulator PdtaR
MSHTILLLDDDRLILQSVGPELVQRGYDVRTASSVEEAVNLLGENSFDIALVDYLIGENTGFDFAVSHLKPANIPFIFLTAFGNQATVEACLSIGAFSYLTKPFQLSQLIPIIEAALARFADFSEVVKRESRLEKALGDARETSIAIGILMERFKYTQDEAFDLLRDHARNRRLKINEVAITIVTACNQLGSVRRTAAEKSVGGPA